MHKPRRLWLSSIALLLVAISCSPEKGPPKAKQAQAPASPPYVHPILGNWAISQSHCAHSTYEVTPLPADSQAFLLRGNGLSCSLTRGPIGIAGGYMFGVNCHPQSRPKLYDVEYNLNSRNDLTLFFGDHWERPAFLHRCAPKPTP